MSEEQLLKPADVARRAQISTKTVLRAIKSGRLRESTRRPRRIPDQEKDYDAWIEESVVAPEVRERPIRFPPARCLRASAGSSYAGDGPPCGKGGRVSSATGLLREDALRAGLPLAWLSGANDAGVTARSTPCGAPAGATSTAWSAARPSTALPTRASGRRRSGDEALRRARRARRRYGDARRVRRGVVAGPRVPEPRALDATHLRDAVERARAASARTLPTAPAHAADDRAVPGRARGAGVGNEAIRKTMSMLQGVLQRA